MSSYAAGFNFALATMQHNRVTLAMTLESLSQQAHTRLLWGEEAEMARGVLDAIRECEFRGAIPTPL